MLPITYRFSQIFAWTLVFTNIYFKNWSLDLQSLGLKQRHTQKAHNDSQGADIVRSTWVSAGVLICLHNFLLTPKRKKSKM